LLRREQKHAGTIERYSRKFQIDPNLVKAIIRAESCYDRYAVSRVGAKGLMQLMPQTAMKMGVENIFDAEENIQGGIRYFSQMLSEFENDLRIALAAYNAGPEAVKKYSGIPPYEETIEYVKRVMGYYQQYSAAGLY
jgi:soluble lytic murein transglycosylase-like protein